MTKLIGMVSFDPTRPDFAPYGFTCVRWRPSAMRRADHHNEIELNLLLRGSLTYLFAGRKVTIRAGQLSAFWAAIPHQVLAYADTRDYFVATIPLAWFLQWRLPKPFVQALLRGELLIDPCADRAPLDASLFTHWIEDLKSAAGERKQAASLEMEARLLRLSLDLAGCKHSARIRGKASALGLGGLNRVEQIACVVAQRYREKLTAQEIGRAVGLHPNYAMNLFQRTFGTTLLGYLTHHRVSHAQRLLATTDKKVVEVAFDSGFTSISRFNEAFRQACGCTPREYRRQHRAECCGGASPLPE